MGQHFPDAMEMDLSGISLTGKVINKLPRGFRIVGHMKVKDPSPPAHFDRHTPQEEFEAYDAPMIHCIVVTFFEETYKFPRMSKFPRKSFFSIETGDYLGEC